MKIANSSGLVNHENPIAFAEAPGSDTDNAHLLGRVSGQESGPTLIAVGGMHGNEPAGVQALQGLLEQIRKQETRIRGDFVALVGNPVALGEGQRFLDIDLNRIWASGNGRQVAEQSDEASAREALKGQITEAERRARGEIIVIDLHTTSAQSGPFCLFGDTLRNRRLARHLPIPLLLGLEEKVPGTLLDYTSERGHIGIAIEAGQHVDPASRVRLEAALWLLLLAAGMVDSSEVPKAQAYRSLLKEASNGAPPVLEVLHRHAITASDKFVMKPGFENFSRVNACQLLASDRKGGVYSIMRGYLLLPLYQGKGEDGFFLGQPVNKVWLWISALLRHLHLDRIMHWMPGISRHPHKPDTLIIRTKTARYFAREIFHLLGFRQERLEYGNLVVSRRPYDLQGPDRSAP